MADQAPSVSSDIHRTPHHVCGVGCAGGACLECDRCQTALLHNRDVSDIKSSLQNLSRFEQDLCRLVEPLQARVKEGNIRPDQVCALIAEARFVELIRAVKQFKLQLPFPSYFEFSETHDDNPSYTNCDNACNSNSAGLISQYKNLTPKQKECLCYCSVFDAEIKKRELINWWIGADLLGASITDSSGRVKKLEQVGEDLLQLLEQKQFIRRLHKKKRASDAWWMEASVRTLIRSKAKDEGLFDFDQEIFSEKVMLLRSDNRIDGLLDSSTAGQVKTVFNVDRLWIGESEAKTLAFMENLAVLHLGRSQSKEPIRVKNLNLIMERLKKLKHLRLLSLQGTLLITKLSDSVSRLTSLVVLDLRACQALELLPSSIGNLKNLSRLDMSGCYILLPLPKGVSLLSNLEVLKGFVIGNDESSEGSKICSLHDLRLLKKLYKLSIFVWRKNFPQSQDLKDLSKIEGLVKLKILWNPASEQDRETAHSDRNEQGQESPDTVMNEQFQENDDTVQHEFSIEEAYLVEDEQCQENVDLVCSHQGQEGAHSAPNVQFEENAEPARNIQGEENAGSNQYEMGSENANVVQNEQGQQNVDQALNLPAESSRHWTPTIFTCCFRNPVEEEDDTEVLEKLEKLDLWYAPEDAGLMLLAPQNFTVLKKLYIRWAKFQNLNYNHNVEEEDKWKAETLRLLFLRKVEMGWVELKNLFPKMSYLEVQDCPKLQFSKDWEDGVWKNQTS